MSPLQLFLQLPVPHTKAPQLLAVAAWQLPVPEQVGAGVNVVPVQVALPQTTEVAAWVQAPPPLQVPVLPQVVVTGHWPLGAATPPPMFEQLPSPFRLQAWQVGQVAVPQQTPLVQKPLMHWFDGCRSGRSASGRSSWRPLVPGR